MRGRRAKFPWRLADGPGSLPPDGGSAFDLPGIAWLREAGATLLGVAWPARRRHPRACVNLRFRYEIAGRAGQAFSRDLSLDGVFLKTDGAGETGARVVLRFALPGDDSPVECEGIVRRVATLDERARGGAGIAIEFVDLSAGDRQRLARFLEPDARRVGDAPTGVPGAGAR